MIGEILEMSRKIEELEEKIKVLSSLNELAQEIVTHPCWNGSAIPKSLKARRDLYVEAWNNLMEIKESE